MGNPDAILTYRGTLRENIINNNIGRIINLSASTVNNSHTRKVLVSKVEDALYYDADCIASHINLTSKYEHEMLSQFGNIVTNCTRYSLPVLAIIYPRGENIDKSDNNYTDLKLNNPEKYANLLCHCVRVAKELGADIIKTHYTGIPDTFVRVIDAARPVPVIIAGGEFIDAKEVLLMAENALKCGCKGISFGRNVFSRKFSKNMVNALSDIVHNNITASNAFNSYYLSNERE